MTVKTRNSESAGVDLMRKRDRLLRLIAADKPIGLSIPAHTQHRGQDRQSAGRQYEFRIVKKVLPRLPQQAHLEIFPRSDLSFNLYYPLSFTCLEVIFYQEVIEVKEPLFKSSRFESLRFIESALRACQ